MLVNSILGKVSLFLPVTAYGFTMTCIEVYNATSPSRVIAAHKAGYLITGEVQLLNTPPYVLHLVKVFSNCLMKTTMT